MYIQICSNYFHKQIPILTSSKISIIRLGHIRNRRRLLDTNIREKRVDFVQTQAPVEVEEDLAVPNSESRVGRQIPDVLQVVVVKDNECVATRDGR